MNWSMLSALRSKISWKRFWEISGWIIGLVALAVGVMHVWELRDITQRLNKFESNFARDTGAIRESLSTKFVGEFPDFLGEVLTTINSAQRELVIVCDFPAYADFSESAKALSLRHALEAKAQAGVKVQLICLGKSRRIEALRMQFDKSNVEKALASPEGRKPFLRYVETDVTRTKPIIYDDFINGFDAKNQIVLAQTFRSADTHEVLSDVPIFFWIADARHAVMVVPAPGGITEYGFKTSDASLVRALLAARDRLVSNAARTSAAQTTKKRAVPDRGGA